MINFFKAVAAEHCQTLLTCLGKSNLAQGKLVDVEKLLHNFM